MYGFHTTSVSTSTMCTIHVHVDLMNFYPGSVLYIIYMIVSLGDYKHGNPRGGNLECKWEISGCPLLCMKACHSTVSNQILDNWLQLLEMRMSIIIYMSVPSS